MEEGTLPSYMVQMQDSKPMRTLHAIYTHPPNAACVALLGAAACLQAMPPPEPYAAVVLLRPDDLGVRVGQALTPVCAVARNPV